LSAPWIVAFVVLWTVVIGVAVIVLGLLRRISAVLEHAETHVAERTSSGLDVGGVPAGTVVGEVELVDEDGHGHREQFDRPTLVLFMSDDCYPCQELGRRLKNAGELLEGVRLFVIADESDSQTRLRVPTEVAVLYQRGGAVSAAFATTTAPHLFYVNTGGIVLDSTVPGSVDDLRRVVDAHARGGERRPKETVLP